jgi:hypothetical protein
LDELAWIRGAERLLIVGFGGMSIYLGYRLFFVVAAGRGALDASVKDWKLSTRNLAPGIFFSLFGMVVLSLALTNTLALGRAQPASFNENTAAAAAVREVQYLDQPPPRTPRDKASELAFALLQVESFLSTDGRTPDLLSLKPSAPRIASARQSIVESALGAGSLEWYERTSRAIAADSTAFGRLTEREKGDFQWLKSVLPKE